MTEPSAEIEHTINDMFEAWVAYRTRMGAPLTGRHEDLRAAFLLGYEAALKTVQKVMEPVN